MSKELEAFERVMDNFPYGEMNEVVGYTLDNLAEDTNLINDGLKRLSVIDNANPSEVLELLKDMMGNIDVNTMYDYCGKSKKDYELIKQALIKSQEQEKVLNNIIEHLSFKYSGTEEYIDFRTNQKVKKYMFKIESKDTGATIHIHLDTQEEFDLLKRYCK